MAGRGHRDGLAGEVVAGEVMSSPPKSWMDVARDEARAAQERLEKAEQNVRQAKAEYDAEPTRIKRLNLLLCRKDYREAKAQAEEWQ